MAQSALQSSQQAPDLTGAVSRGAELASTIEGMQSRREALELQKQQHQLAKATAITETFKSAAGTEDKRLRKFLLEKVAPAKIKALGMEDVFPPSMLQLAQTSDEMLEKVTGTMLELEDKVNKGAMTGAAAYAEAKRRFQGDPEALMMLDGDRFFAAQKFSASEEGKGYRAKLAADEAEARAKAARDDAGRVEFKKAVGAEAGKYATGGRTKFENAIKKFDNVLSKLDSGEVTTGGWTTFVPGLNSEAAQYAINEAKQNAKNDVQAIYEESLKETMGTQFTEGEGKRRLNRIWNDNASSQENARRLRADIGKLQEEMNAKEATFKAEGHRIGGGKRGWTGLSPDKKKAFKALPKDQQEKAIKGLLEKFDITMEQLKAELGL